jgi:acyl-CoA synthetase (AMP-forming)/AMP-acid ligase II
VCEAKFVFTTKNLANEVLEATQGLNGQVQILLSGSDHPGCVDIESTRIDEHLPSLLSLSSLGMKLDDPAVIYFSSGTTGLQKGLLLSNCNLQNASLLLRLPQCSIVSADSPDVLVFAPFSHVTGSLLVSVSLSAGLTCHLMLRFDFEEFLRQVEEKRIKRFLTVPPVATMMAKSPVTEKYKLDFVKDINVGGGRISAEVEDLLMQKFPGAIIRQMYGLTETTGMICDICYEEDTRKFIRKPASGGVPCPGTQLKVIDIKTGEALGPKETGEICVKSPSVMLGYVNNPQATAETIDKDGWLHSGDIGYYDEDGYIYIVDRLKELIKYNSYQVAPAELEAVLMSHPQVADAGVVGLPDSSAGELPLAWVVRKPNVTVTESELQQFVDGKVAPYKKLRGGVHFVSDIPKTSSGKILRREIKAAILKGKL